MQTVGIVLNVGNDHVESFEAGFREMELPISQCSHDRGVTQNPWIRTMVSAAVGSELTAWSLLNRFEEPNSRAQDGN